MLLCGFLGGVRIPPRPGAGAALPLAGGREQRGCHPRHHGTGLGGGQAALGGPWQGATGPALMATSPPSSPRNVWACLAQHFWGLEGGGQGSHGTPHTPPQAQPALAALQWPPPWGNWGGTQPSPCPPTSLPPPFIFVCNKHVSGARGLRVIRCHHPGGGNTCSPTPPTSPCLKVGDRDICGWPSWAPGMGSHLRGGGDWILGAFGRVDMGSIAGGGGS